MLSFRSKNSLNPEPQTPFQASLSNLVRGQYEINKVARNRALAGVQQPHNLPAETVLHILDEGLSALVQRFYSSHALAGMMKNNIYEFLTEAELPRGIAQFFSLQDKSSLFHSPLCNVDYAQHSQYPDK